MRVLRVGEDEPLRRLSRESVQERDDRRRRHQVLREGSRRRAPPGLPLPQHVDLCGVHRPRLRLRREDQPEGASRKNVLAQLRNLYRYLLPFVVMHVININISTSFSQLVKLLEINNYLYNTK